MKTGTLVGKTLGNYLVTEQIGCGGMGSVYLGEHPDIGRKVAIKVLAPHLSHQPGLAERFLTEAQAVARISHPNVIEIYDFSRKKGQFFYVMEYLKGEELAAVMHREKRMSASDALPYLEQICAGIQAAHDVGIIHRDLKPENIVVLEGKTLQLKLIDFGLVKLVGPDTSPNNLTATGMVMGSPLTMAPEQVSAQLDKIGPATDLYSIGIIAYWMLAGRPPFLNHPRPMLMTMHMTTAPPPLLELAPWVPAEIAELVESCLAKDPADRPASASEFSELFRRGAAKSGKMSMAEMKTLAPTPSTRDSADDLRAKMAGLATIGSNPPHAMDSGDARQPTPARSGTQMRPPEATGPHRPVILRQGPHDAPLGSGNTTTMGGATGQLHASTDLHRRRGLNWLAPMVAVVAVGVAVFLGLRVNAPPASNSSLMLGKVSGASQPPTPSSSRTMRVIAVSTNDPTAQCKSSIDGKGRPVQSPPCRLVVPEGSRLELTVEQKDLTAFQKTWNVQRAQTFALEPNAENSALVERTQKANGGTDSKPANAAPSEGIKTELEKGEKIAAAAKTKPLGGAAVPPTNHRTKRAAKRKRGPSRKSPASVKAETKEQPQSSGSLEGTVSF